MMRFRVSADSLYAVLGKRIAEARAKRSGGKWSQAQLAKACNLTRGSIANIELGRQRAPLHTIWQIGAALGIEPRLLLPTSGEYSAGSQQLEAWITAAESALGGSENSLLTGEKHEHGDTGSGIAARAQHLKAPNRRVARRKASRSTR